MTIGSSEPPSPFPPPAPSSPLPPQAASASIATAPTPIPRVNRFVDIRPPSLVQDALSKALSGQYVVRPDGRKTVARSLPSASPTGGRDPALGEGEGREGPGPGLGQGGTPGAGPWMT